MKNFFFVIPRGSGSTSLTTLSLSKGKQGTQSQSYSWTPALVRLATARSPLLRTILSEPKASRRAAGVTAGILIFCLPFCLHAQGLLPPPPKTSTETTTSPAYLQIGQKIPDSVTVQEKSGNRRSLLSFKAPVDVLVAGFYSTRCPANQAQWNDLRHFFEAYKDWHVVFLGVSVQSDENASVLSEAMAKAGLTYAVVRDEHQKASRQFRITATPSIAIIDEWGQLRYRGPLKGQAPGSGKTALYARKALEAVIGHTEAVPDPEPEMTGCLVQ